MYHTSYIYNTTPLVPAVLEIDPGLHGGWCAICISCIYHAYKYTSVVISLHIIIYDLLPGFLSGLDLDKP